MSDSPRLYSIASGQPFLDHLARSLFDDAARQQLYGACALSDVQVLLPTRRAARELANIFLQLAEDQGTGALLLPRIETLGDIDEDAPQAGRDRLDLAPAMEPMARHFYLLPLIRRWLELAGQPLHPVKLSGLAFDLENFFDQAQNEQIDFQKLPDLVLGELAENWQKTLSFLTIITDIWTKDVATMGCLDPTDRRNKLLAQRTQEWQTNPPSHPIIAAGSTGSILATADLLKVIARLPKGSVVLPGLDSQADEALWEAIENDFAHPQHAMAKLLKHMEAPRAQVKPWPGSAPASPRAQRLNLALVPAAETAHWAQQVQLSKEAAEPSPSSALSDLHLVEAPDARAEAGVIALLMRETLTRPDKTAALVTRDRNLARRVASELRRWGVTIDDSAGQPLSNSQRGTFLRLVLACRASDFAPIDLLAMLKHPLVDLLGARAKHRKLTRLLERHFLRGPRLQGGLPGLAAAVKNHPHLDEAARAELQDFLARLAKAYAPLQELPDEAGMNQHLDGLLVCAEALLCPEQEEAQGTRLFTPDEEGKALADLVDKLYQHAEAAGPIARQDWPSLLDMWMMRQTLRRQMPTHARLFIWGPLEARLMQADVMILGGLNETSWPPLPETGPWLSRPMRTALGMSQPERQIGMAAHDFVQGAAAPTTYLTRSEKMDGSPSVAARWLRRLETLSGKLPRHEQYRLLDWWARFDTAEQVQSAPKPAPRPPVAARPKQLSVTQIEILLHNPYEIYAKKVLALREWEPADAPASAAHRGTLLHGLMEDLVRSGGYKSDDVAGALMALAQTAQQAQPGGAAVLQHWQARLSALSEWVADYEAARQAEVAQSYPEVHGEMALDIGGAAFTVTAKADRLDKRHDGRFDIIDYKTGQPPSKASLEKHLSPQLTLEAAILEAGGFTASGEVLQGHVHQLRYLHLTGREPAGEVKPMVSQPQWVDGVRAMVERLIAEYQKPERPYAVHIRPRKTNFSGAYDHLARRKEWQADADEASDEARDGGET
ncbi:MAG: double-strand break repair protein AddB [Rhodobiaceae bacterium]|jgi:ATP-dependent helicase/nuclease subunit B|nr:double-strand break repair protein AddB [Rhodobiaceae bacterium]